MELKVWVEGIQRIVCGVNEKTTCQDVVYALAHATAKTGRFTLVERWRNSERLLAPNEVLRTVLLKWGEHSSDVQFILQWAPLDSGGAKGPAKNVSEPQNTFSKNNPNLSSPGSNGTSSKHKSSPFSSNVGNLPSPSEGGGSLKRSKESAPSGGVVKGVSHNRNNESLINSGPSAMDNSSTGSNGKVNSANNSVNGGGSNKVWSGDGSDYSFDSDSPSKNLKDLNLSSPPPYRDPPNPTKGLSHSPITSAGLNSHKGLPPYREPPPPNLSHQQVQMQQQHHGSGSGSPVVNHQQTTHLINNNSGSNSIQSGSPVIGSSHNASIFDSNVPTQSSRTNESYSSSPSYSGDKTDESESWKKDHSITNGDISASSQNGCLPKPTTSVASSNSQYQELVRLINLQREKLTTQHAEMTQYDAEILFWEGKAREQQRHLEFITKEISRLEIVSAQQESQVLSLLHLEEENEHVKCQSSQLKSDIDALRTEFSNCEKELTLCKNKMTTLTNELHMQQLSMQQRQEDWMQREANTLAEIDRLKKELDLARRETDVVTDLSGTLDDEVSSVEADLTAKRKQMEALINQMKQANLQSLTIQPPDESSIEGGTRFFRSTGSGSTRRMIGSLPLPSYPTSKNPHGVWV